MDAATATQLSKQAKALKQKQAVQFAREQAQRAKKLRKENIKYARDIKWPEIQKKIELAATEKGEFKIVVPFSNEDQSNEIERLARKAGFGTEVEYRPDLRAEYDWEKWYLTLFWG